MSQLQACPECGQPIGGSAEVCPLCGHALAAAKPPQVWRIPCPNGHVSKVAEALIGRQLACPKCNEQFVARIADSLEQRQQARQRQAKHEEELAAKWLARAIWAGVIFGLLLVTLFVLSAMRR
jgi:uncharacterized membrane protein YvbJ